MSKPVVAWHSLASPEPLAPPDEPVVLATVYGRVIPTDNPTREPERVLDVNVVVKGSKRRTK